MLLPQQLAVWRRDAFWYREPKSQNNPSRRTEPRPSGTHFWLTTRRPVLRCEPLGPCCLRLRLPLRALAGGTENFSPSSASSPVSGLCHPAHVLCVGGPRYHQNLSPGQDRSAATCRGRPELELDEQGNFSKFQPCPISLQIEAKCGRTTGEITTCRVAATQ